MQQAPSTLSATSAATIRNFDALPESARLDIGVIKALTCKSRATIYRWIAAGILPKPHKLGATHNYWTAGEIRRALAGGADK